MTHESIRQISKRLYQGMLNRVRTEPHYRRLGCTIPEHDFMVWAFHRIDDLRTKYPWASPSVDRINSRRGYHLDNIRILPLPANRLDSALVRKLVNADNTPDHFKPDHFKLVAETIGKFFGPKFKVHLTLDGGLSLMSVEGVTSIPSTSPENPMKLTTTLNSRIKKEIQSFGLKFYDTDSKLARADANAFFPMEINPQTDIDYDVNLRNQIRLEQPIELFKDSIAQMVDSMNQKVEFDMTLCADASAWAEVDGLSPQEGKYANADGRTRMGAAKEYGVTSMTILFTNCTDLTKLTQIGRRLNCLNGLPPDVRERIRYAIEELKEMSPEEIKRLAPIVCRRYMIEGKQKAVIAECGKRQFFALQTTRLKTFGDMTQAQKDAVYQVVTSLPEAIAGDQEADEVVSAFADIAHDRGTTLSPEVIKSVGEALNGKNKKINSSFMQNPTEFVKSAVTDETTGIGQGTVKTTSSSVFLSDVTKLHGKSKSGSKLIWKAAVCQNMIVMLEEIKVFLTAKKAQAAKLKTNV